MSLSSTYLSIKELLADNLNAKGVDASSTNGLTTLSNKVLDIKTNQFFILDSDADLDTDTDYVLDEAIEPRMFGQYMSDDTIDKTPESIWNNTNGLTITSVPYEQTQGGSAQLTNDNATWLKTPFALLNDYVLSFDFQETWNTGSGSGRYFFMFGNSGRYRIGVDVGDTVINDQTKNPAQIGTLEDHSSLYNQNKHHCQIIRKNNILNVVIDDRYIIGGLDAANEPNIFGLRKWGNGNNDHWIKVDNITLYMKRQNKMESYLIKDINDYTRITGTGEITLANPMRVYNCHVINNNQITTKNTYILTYKWRLLNGKNAGFSMGAPNNFWICMAEDDMITVKHGEDILAQTPFNSGTYDLQFTPPVQITRNNNHWNIDISGNGKNFQLDFDCDCQNNFGMKALSGTGSMFSELKIINSTVWDDI